LTRIRRIEAIPIRVPLETPFSGATFTLTNRSTIITRVHTDDGLVGECYNGDSDEELEQIARIVEDEIGPLLEGADPLAVEECWVRMFPVTDRLRRPRIVSLEAVACVDSALWDLAGKAAGTSLHRLWGGFTDSLPVIVIGGYYADAPGALERETERYLEMGFKGSKFKIGGRTPEQDADRVRRVRGVVGDDYTIVVDANQGYSRSEAILFARLTADLGLRWFEEPCAWPNDRLAMRDVRHATGVPVCAGQSETTPAAARDLIALGAIDVCNFDASWTGGPTVWRRVAGMAHLYGVEMAHHEEPQIAAQLLSSVSHGTYLECFLPERDPIFWNLVENRGDIVDGRYPVPSGPGFGLALDEAFIARYRV
jgi:D-galactarolactone cycloisomerase